MSIRTEKTKYHFEILAPMSIRERLEYGKTEGLRELIGALSRDLETLERFTVSIEAGESYSIGPNSVCTWWGWG